MAEDYVLVKRATKTIGRHPGPDFSKLSAIELASAPAAEAAGALRKISNSRVVNEATGLESHSRLQSIAGKPRLHYLLRGRPPKRSRLLDYPLLFGFGTNWYPKPRTVRRYLGLEGSRSM